MLWSNVMLWGMCVCLPFDADFNTLTYCFVFCRRYEAIPQLESKLARLKTEKDQAEGGNLLSEVVGQDQIAEVVARWTGIPVTKVRQRGGEEG